MKTIIESRVGEFYGLAGHFLLPTRFIEAGTELEVGSRLPINCMFDVHFAMLGEERVGFLFTTRFSVKNGGSYLMTYLKGKPPAQEAEVLLKSDDLVLYHFPNNGSLAVSPIVNQEINTIFIEQ
jgi:hypothetical protein